MLYKKSGEFEIHGLFPKPIFKVDNLLINKLDYYKKLIKSYNKKLTRNDYNNVDSSHQLINIHKENNFKELFDSILKYTKYFLKETGYDNIDNIKINNSWFNISKKNDYLQKHIHKGSLISGAFYIKSGKNDTIDFFDNNDMTTDPERCTEISLSSTSFSFDCVPARLLLFKSSLEHGTPKQTSKEKIVISFNINIQ
tara:strand:- start:29 stop:619 length:591 start_codon:yes stop_codon:yes gene_type:complete